ncbi:arginine metabolism regulation II [Fusarium albosuccineum]|uniref:Arginine metabolism regulation II n=1 Tax=Fusarium albosuccineum TaxID=1237068 RepID=A0A8H4PFQ8_9HYPO|nr:arginine metabolism regulation II [Fusarium albosuccineum]
MTLRLPRRKRSKVFTGCWTCRLRRLKCDEGKPECAVCIDRGIECGGYNIRLQWLPPVDNVNTIGRSPNGSKGEQSRRRTLPATRNLRLSNEQVDSAILDIEEAELGQETRSVGPFSVFPAVVSIVPPESRVSQESVGYDEFEDKTDNLGGLSAHEDSLGNGVNDTTSNRQTVSPSDVTDIISWPPSIQDALSTPTQSILSQSGASADTKVDHGDKPKVLIDYELLFRPSFLTTEVKHLMHHYSENVIPLFAVIDSRDTPWRCFYLPRALQCCSELEINGKSTPARRALLHATLAVSAFHLRNLAERQELGVAHGWTSVRSRHRTYALEFLQESAGDPYAASTSSGYKELLAAMLSMTAINVFSGDTETREIHLKGCESLIRARRNTHSNPSATTQALHGIFYYLRIMQDATDAWMTQDKVQTYEYLDDTDPILDVDDEKFNDKTGSFSFELAYAVPRSLLLLLHKTCRLLRTLIRLSSRNDKTMKITTMLACDRLEEELMSFPIEEEIRRLKHAAVDESNICVVQHYMRAFYHTTIIFFNSKVRRTHPRFLQKHVDLVVCHMNAGKKIKHEEGIATRVVLWPAVVAGQQAIETSTRQEILKLVSYRRSAWSCNCKDDWGVVRELLE